MPRFFVQQEWVSSIIYKNHKQYTMGTEHEKFKAGLMFIAPRSALHPVGNSGTNQDRLCGLMVYNMVFCSMFIAFCQLGLQADLFAGQQCADWYLPRLDARTVLQDDS